MIFVGIDPGLKGAIAFLGDGAVPALVSMPVIKRLRGEGRDQIDMVGLRDLLQSWLPLGFGCFVTVERGQALPPGMGGGVTNFARGYHRGILEGLLVALRIPYQLVPPQTWQREMLQGAPAGDTGQRSIMAAQRLFPGVSLLRTPACRKADDGLSDGLAEALLLAEYGRRTHQGEHAQRA